MLALLLSALSGYSRINNTVLKVYAVVLNDGHFLDGDELEAVLDKGRNDLLGSFGRGLVEVVHQDDVAVFYLADDGSAYFVGIPALPVT